MRPYEVMIIYEPGMEEDDVRAAVDRSTALVKARGGTIGRVDRWGKRRLAYEIRHQREGYYVLVEASSEPPAMAELDRALMLADDVLRHKVIRLPDRVAGRPRPAPSPRGFEAEPGVQPSVAAPEAADSTQHVNGA